MFRAKKCVQVKRSHDVYDVTEHIKVKKADEWYFFDLLAYHIDRLLNFHISPITVSYTHEVEHLLEAFDMNNAKHNYTTVDEIRDALKYCDWLKPTYTIKDGKMMTFGSIQAKIKYRDNLRLDTISGMWRGSRQLHCVAKTECQTTEESISKVYL
eukprot:UN34610